MIMERPNVCHTTNVRAFTMPKWSLALRSNVNVRIYTTPNDFYGKIDRLRVNFDRLRYFILYK